MFISYAQNFEDVILWRALKDVKNGFYIDIGAQDPVTDSVSKAFFDHGWRGLHAEASRYYANKLRAARPGEHVEHSAIGSEAGVIDFFEISDTGLSTSDYEIAQRHREEGRDINKIQVTTAPLSHLFDMAKGREIHWLKIDVEGMEHSVIESWSPSPARPWIVVVESTLPNTQISSHEKWEGTLLSLGYTFVYFDGLNRFYVSLQHPELVHHFGPGPNFFDYFKLSNCSIFTLKKDESILSIRNEINIINERISIVDRNIAQLNENISKNNERNQRIVDIIKNPPLHIFLYLRKRLRGKAR